MRSVLHKVHLMVALALGAIFTTTAAMAACPAPTIDTNDFIFQTTSNGSSAMAFGIGSQVSYRVAEGTFYYDRAAKDLLICDGTTWKPIGYSGGGGTGNPSGPTTETVQTLAGIAGNGSGFTTARTTTLDYAGKWVEFKIGVAPAKFLAFSTDSGFDVAKKNITCWLQVYDRRTASWKSVWEKTGSWIIQNEGYQKYYHHGYQNLSIMLQPVATAYHMLQDGTVIDWDGRIRMAQPGNNTNIWCGTMTKAWFDNHVTYSTPTSTAVVARVTDTGYSPTSFTVTTIE